VQALGVAGSVLVEINGRLTDQAAELHRHALRLLESPGGAAGGATAWADLGWCALTVGDRDIAAEVFEKGLNYPSMFMQLERPRHLAGLALLMLERGDLDDAERLADEACAYVQEREMRYCYPLVHWVNGQVQTSAGNHVGALEQFDVAERWAFELGFRPLLWQTKVAVARSLAALGQSEAAGQELAEARVIIDKIADLFQDTGLRQAYGEHITRQLAGAMAI
jgi:ATP/maltotriose-dependent transcriptional regulator MalT